MNRSMIEFAINFLNSNYNHFFVCVSCDFEIGAVKLFFRMKFIGMKTNYLVSIFMCVCYVQTRSLLIRSLAFMMFRVLVCPINFLPPKAREHVELMSGSDLL